MAKKHELVKIIDGYAFDYDESNYILYAIGMREKGVFGSTTEKTGELVEYKEILGFYSSITTMCMAVLNIETKKSAENANVQTLGDFLAIMEQISQRIKQSVDITAF
jgi:hypothetical protein